MKIEAHFDPVFYLTVPRLFPSKINKAIIKEAQDNKKLFEESRIGGGHIPEFRSNTVAYYDTIYNNKRHTSPLLNAIDGLFKRKDIREVLSSSPLNEFTLTNRHETQVSRYGNDEQFYNWHIDRFEDRSRAVTFVYYFNEEPKPYSGGELQFTNSPITDGKPIVKDPNIVTIEPQNNLGVFFSSTTPHKVCPTISPNAFNRGRFSVNCWIGFA
jgi:Rps23 Pro-64 3,4-dihydroxylase Tpa1-like proline 4-hydroxylase